MYIYNNIIYIAKMKKTKNRDGRIRTCDFLLPKQTRYQTALHPVVKLLYINSIYAEYIYSQ